MTQAELGLDLGWRQDLLALEDEGLRAVLEAELVDEGHPSVGDQTYEGVLRDEA